MGARGTWTRGSPQGRTQAFSVHPVDLLLSAEVSGGDRLDCVKASDQCLKEQSCSTKYRTLRQCVAGKETNFSLTSGLEAKDECRSAMDALKQRSLYNCRCRRGMKKEKNCLRIYWSLYQSLQGTHPAPQRRQPRSSPRPGRLSSSPCFSQLRNEDLSLAPRDSGSWCLLQLSSVGKSTRGWGRPGTPLIFLKPSQNLRGGTLKCYPRNPLLGQPEASERLACTGHGVFLLSAL